MQDYIEAEYGRQIALVEQYCVDFPKGEPRDDYWRLNDKKVASIEYSLRDKEIATACCSLDGHHGVEGLKKPMESGVIYHRFPMFPSHNSHGTRSLYYGETSDHRSLLVYEGRVSEGGLHHFQITFFLDDIWRAANSR